MTIMANMTIINNQIEIEAAQALLTRSGLSLLDASRLICELLDETPARQRPAFQHCRQVIRVAAQAIHCEEQRVSFEEAVERSLTSKAHRRPRTLREIRSVARNLMDGMPEFGAKSLRDITTGDCQTLLRARERSPRQFSKARIILSGIFNFGIRQGWCSVNPVTGIEAPNLQESVIRPLSPLEIGRIKHVLRRECFRPLWPAIGLMLYAGIRPNEVTRLKWRDINLEEKIVTLRPRHSKTGGVRHVHIPPVLERCLRSFRPLDSDKPIAPPNWDRKWKRFRLSAGFSKWQQDCLRHTYASYHAKYYRNFPLLQMEMGHRSADLLRTRYLNMEGITRQDAYYFWH